MDYNTAYPPPQPPQYNSYPQQQQPADHYNPYPTPQNNWGPSTNVHLKPIPYATERPLSAASSHDSYYKPLSSSPYAPTTNDTDNLSYVSTADSKLKARIRLLRMVSRSLATLLSAVTIAPLAITLVKFFQTRNTTFLVDGVERTAWASGTITWYTYMYTAVSVVSFLFNAAILISYIRGVKQANATAKIASFWSGLILGAHVVVWAVSVAIYRYGKEPVDGSFKDLWGWTCSEAAEAIQGEITNINYSQFCAIQGTSFFTGIANTVAGILSGVIYIFAILRLRSKKKVKNASFRFDEAREPLRQ